jgi:hypothetical protein
MTTFSLLPSRLSHTTLLPSVLSLLLFHVQPVRTNQVFFSLPERVLAGVLSDGHACLDSGAFHGKKPGELLRAVCCWATTEAEVDAFLASVRTHAMSVPSTSGPSGGASLRAFVGAAVPEQTDKVDAATLQGRNPEVGVPEWPGLAAVALGTKTTFKHKVDEDTDGRFAMPVFCVRGAADGPTVLVLAGVRWAPTVCVCVCARARVCARFEPLGFIDLLKGLIDGPHSIDHLHPIAPTAGLLALL